MLLNEAKFIITGAGSGMGFAFAESMIKAGGKVMAWDINMEGLQTLQIQCASESLHIAQVDVSQESQVITAMQHAWDLLDGFNGLINNAGIFRDSLLVKKDKKTGDIRTMSLQQWQKVIDVDLTGPFLCTREFSACLINMPATDAVVINMTSISQAGNMGQSNYSAAKAGLLADTVTWAKELARYKIRVAAIAPGFIETPLLQGMRSTMIEKMLAMVPSARLGQVQEIFAGIRFICECEYFTGRCLEIDGGLRL
jgi:3-oxoacyl-[acyl-carrier protein] reductase